MLGAATQGIAARAEILTTARTERGSEAGSLADLVTPICKGSLLGAVAYLAGRMYLDRVDVLDDPQDERSGEDCCAAANNRRRSPAGPPCFGGGGLDHGLSVKRGPTWDPGGPGRNPLELRSRTWSRRVPSASRSWDCGWR
jgi:hypothetical protein